ncbi:hypothetical protein L198_00130 [Cryptococcus wingfieldii CBS 7118]|uniref:Uncharacterized protein n=1 Tax=Cryptococcus wingfieldii CBS 7118 TaxID=1295528 RepID=A0A1E3K5R3_9TREE|nr:hypothetical protein L198_00130 [Cryptococcus wingfieldii CBS 7118]ODO08401.1 hypothetical protein L198_00130 [Cryptococcus wingfieldii CBS 7118]
MSSPSTPTTSRLDHVLPIQPPTTGVSTSENMADRYLVKINQECRRLDILAQKTFDVFNMLCKGTFDAEKYWEDRELEKMKYLEKALGGYNVASTVSHERHCTLESPTSSHSEDEACHGGKTPLF